MQALLIRCHRTRAVRLSPVVARDVSAVESRVSLHRLMLPLATDVGLKAPDLVPVGRDELPVRLPAPELLPFPIGMLVTSPAIGTTPVLALTAKRSLAGRAIDRSVSLRLEELVAKDSREAIPSSLLLAFGIAERHDDRRRVDAADERQPLASCISNPVDVSHACRLTGASCRPLRADSASEQRCRRSWGIVTRRECSRCPGSDRGKSPLRTRRERVART